MCFLFESENAVYFQLMSDVKAEGQSEKKKPGLAKATQATAGALLPYEHWNTKFTTLQWILRWQTKKGLQPIRPQITWTGPDITIPSLKALRLPVAS